MSEQFTLNAEIRSDLGKGASRRLRRQADKVPAIIYGANKPAETISLVHKDILKALQHEAFFSSILNLTIDGKQQKAVLKDMHRHPSKAQILHMDFMRVSATEKISMHVPIHLIGEDKAIGVKTGGTVTKCLSELEIKCLPADLPESINVDITDLKLDQSIHISEVQLPNGVELTTAIEDDAHDHPVVSISVPRVAAEPEGTEAPAANEVPSDQKDDAGDKEKAVKNKSEN